MAFVGIRGYMLVKALYEIDEIKEEGKQCDFPVPMLDICELGHEFSLLDTLSVDMKARYRDPFNSSKYEKTPLVKKTFSNTGALIVNLDDSIFDPSACLHNRSHCRKIVYHCYRFDPARKDPPQRDPLGLGRAPAG